MTESQLRTQIVDRAKSWAGRKEADGSHREIIDVYNSIDPLPRGYRMTYSDPWCAAFISACAQVLGLTKTVFPECGCIPMINLYKQHGRWMEDDAYRPQPGDVIFYDWEDSGGGDNVGASDHVGLVTGVDGGVISIIEGNCGNAVQYTARKINSRYIRGYGLPDYASMADGIEEPPGVVIIPDEDTSSDADASPSPGGEGCCMVELPVLMVGDVGEAVRAAQILLEKRGYKCGWMGCDGEFGDKTQSAVGKFQRARGLTQDGIVGPLTWAALIKLT